MKHRDFETMLTKALHTPPQEENRDRLNTTVLLAKAQARRRTERKRNSFRQFFFRQVRYVGWRLWLTQGVFLLLFDRMVVQLYGERFWDSPTSVARLLFCLSTLVAMMALPLLYRSIRYQMQEIEGAAYFSSVKLLMARLAAIGLGDFGLLAGIFLTTLVRTSMEAGSLTFCLALPFLTMCAADLYLMGHCSSRGFLAGSLTLGVGMILLSLGLPGRWLPQLRESMTLGWLAFCGVMLTFCGGQLRYLLGRSPYGELQLPASS